MQTTWDYTNLAEAYLKRPDYAWPAIDAMLAVAGVRRGAKACDVGAGVAHLTLMLAARGLEVSAVEPNDAMRQRGMARTAALPNVTWSEGVGERTGQPAAAFDLVTFGSSFNVCDRAKALAETHRILVPGGYFACMWNNRRLDDPVQARIESLIQMHVPNYKYGTRREDQTEAIDASGLFGGVVHLDAQVMHEQTLEECVEAWRSHATLERQAKAAFPDIVAGIETMLRGLGQNTIRIPYTTNIWIAQALRT
jgi:ubiquinone/menaquinone biosynthesis C-methylase UbiE